MKYQQKLLILNRTENGEPTMSFDDNRLEVAKMLYQNCVDRRNYFVVHEAFDFDSARRKLDDYISRF